MIVKVIDELSKLQSVLCIIGAKIYWYYYKKKEKE